MDTPAVLTAHDYQTHLVERQRHFGFLYPLVVAWALAHDVDIADTWAVGDLTPALDWYDTTDSATRTDMFPTHLGEHPTVEELRAVEATRHRVTAAVTAAATAWVTAHHAVPADTTVTVLSYGHDIAVVEAADCRHHVPVDWLFGWWATHLTVAR